MAISVDQTKICRIYQTKAFESPDNQKIGISIATRNKELFPINGLRHFPHGDTTGWYIWAGEDFSDDPDFFVPLHVNHINDWRPEVEKYLALPPGFRFLIGENGYVDVWFDASLLEV